MLNIIGKITYYFNSISLKECLENIDYSNNFISFSINKELSNDNQMKRVIQLDDPQGKEIQFILYKQNNEVLGKYYENKSLLFFTQREEEYLIRMYIEKVAQLFHHSIDRAKELLVIDSKINSDIDSEFKSLEWIKASLVVLKSAITKSLEDPHYIFDGQFFCGNRNDDESFQMRIQCLSLDLLLIFLEDGRLRVSIWDYRNLKSDSKVEPIFFGEFTKLKQPLFDEFIKLLVEVSKAATRIS
jgi:hypothetical protein